MTTGNWVSPSETTWCTIPQTNTPICQRLHISELYNSRCTEPSVQYSTPAKIWSTESHSYCNGTLSYIYTGVLMSIINLIQCHHDNINILLMHHNIKLLMSSSSSPMVESTCILPTAFGQLCFVFELLFFKQLH